MEILPGKFIVFEGIDGAGKSTQVELLRKRLLDSKTAQYPFPYFTHQPSGNALETKMIYTILENTKMPDIARQMLHLACHVYDYEYSILPHLKNKVPVVLDRCWMSGIAYGWHAGELKHHMTEEQVTWLVQLPTMGFMPELVFIHLDAHVQDDNNSPALIQGYAKILEQNLDTCVQVPLMNKEDTHEFIVKTLIERGIAEDA